MIALSLDQVAGIVGGRVEGDGGAEVALRRLELPQRLAEGRTGGLIAAVGRG